MSEALLARLRACLAEPVPSVEERIALAGALDALGASAELADAARSIERAKARTELAVAAARAMRLVMQSAALAAAAEPEEVPSAEKRRANKQAALERKQVRAIAESKGESTRPHEQPVEKLPGIGRASGLALRARGLCTFGDLAWLLPLGYHDEREVTPIGELKLGERQVTEGKVVSARYGGRRMAEVIVEEPDKPTGMGARLRLSWFHAPGGLVERFAEGARFRVAGLVETYRGMTSMSHPQTERLDSALGAQGRGIVPRYAPVPGVPPKTLRRVVALAVERCANDVPDAVPATVRESEGLPPLRDALRALHAPPPSLSPEELVQWNEMRTPHHARLAFEEFFVLELALHQRRVDEQGVRGEALQPLETALSRARAALPFALTRAQERVVAEIGEDLRADTPMRRLLQGDVGSGKTAVALLAAAHAISAGSQVAFMAPTEILAEQHFRSLAPVAEAMGLRAALVLGGARASHRRSTRKGLSEGRIDFAVGTHALLSEGVELARLRLVIVDEQHRFGVGQRLRLVDKAGQGLAPHLLVMTATPIPRTLALAAYGDLAASVLDEAPPGRVPPVTRAYRIEERGEALRQLERALEADGRAYVVCPTIEPNEETGLRSVLETHEELSKRCERWGVALLHGQLPQEAKQEALQRFASGQARVLVATTIVEVGLDVPSANCILIENAERFGLAQLHQLRGRVGRGGQKSACLLVHEASSELSRERIQVLCDSHDGFRLAEEDLRLRGPGELFGRKQSGLPGFRFGDLRRDQPLLVRARELARAMHERDPELRAPEHAEARLALERLAASDRAPVKEEAG